MDTEKLMASLREKQGYKEMEQKLTEIVKAQDMMNEIKGPEIMVKISETDDEDATARLVEDLKYRLVEKLVAMVVDKDKLSSEELVFMMMLVEDIALKLVREHVAKYLKP